jgi:hypothetical protein
MKTYALYALALLVPFGCCALALYRLYRRHQRWLAEAAQKADADIHPPVVRFCGHDDGLRLKTKAQRDIATKLKHRAAKVDSGVLTDVEQLRVVKR